MTDKINLQATIMEEDLEWLMPRKRSIVVGGKKFEIEELVSEQYKKLIGTISKIINELYALKEDTAAMSDDSVYVSRLVQFIADDIVPILHIVTGVSEEEIDRAITSKQILYAARVIWEMNAQDLIGMYVETRDLIYNNLGLFGDENDLKPDGEDDTIGTPLEDAQGA